MFWVSVVCGMGLGVLGVVAYKPEQFSGTRTVP